MAYLIQPALSHTSDFACFFSTVDWTIFKHRQGVQETMDFSRFSEEEIQLRNALAYHCGFLQS